MFQFRQKFPILRKVRVITKNNLKKVKNILFTLLLTTTFVLSSYTPLEIQATKVKVLVIDAGHGGKDPGCHGAKSKEAHVALAVAQELARIVRENLPDVKVILTRDSDHFVELHERANIANKANADFFISIHCNSGPSAAYGTETFTMGLHKTASQLAVQKRENDVIKKEDNYLDKYDGFDPDSPESEIIFQIIQSAGIQNSLSLAAKVENQFKNRVSRHSRGVKQAGLLVLWKTKMPSVLIELGFLTNSDEETYLNNKYNQVLMASGIYRAFKEYKIEIENQ
jgi:N-acetylmuramoyl-L-alanine amidase